MKVNRSHSVSDSPIGIKPRQSHFILWIMIYQQGMGINPAEKEETGENEAENEIEVPNIAKQCFMDLKNTVLKHLDFGTSYLFARDFVIEH